VFGHGRGGHRGPKHRATSRRHGACSLRTGRHAHNNAGIYIGKSFTEYTLADYTAITAVNLTGFFHITQLAIAHMAR
jgi:NAD(P)-dependent dehydrogenase (short-subunit alcohol dehydrogenase family)